MKIKDEIFRIQGKPICETQHSVKFNLSLLTLKAGIHVFNKSELELFINWLLSQLDLMRD